MNFTNDLTLPSNGNAAAIVGSISINNSTTDTRMGSSTYTVDPNIYVQGDAVFEGDIKWKGRDMREWFESVETRLSLLRPNPELEREWSELAELRQRYVALERKILAKQELYDILKKN